MKKLHVSMIAGWFSISAMAAVPAVVGDWQGSLNAGGGSLKAVFHISQDQDGSFTGTMDSPDQGVAGIPMSTVSFKAPDVHLEIARYGASYDGKVDRTEIAGQWKQGGVSLRLNLKRVMAASGSREGLQIGVRGVPQLRVVVSMGRLNASNRSTTQQGDLHAIRYSGEGKFGRHPDLLRGSRLGQSGGSDSWVSAERRVVGTADRGAVEGGAPRDRV
jgi:hypothetical protein